MPKRVSLGGQVILAHDRLARTLKVLRTQGKVVTLLCTDIDVLTPPAVRALRSASIRGHHLVVGLLDDASLELRDGVPPLLGQELRAEVVAAVEGVSYVTLVEAGGVEELVRVLRPSVVARCSGEDARSGQIEESLGKEIGARIATVGDEKPVTNRRFRKALERRGLLAAAPGAGKTAAVKKAGAAKASSARKLTASAKKAVVKKAVAKKAVAKKATTKSSTRTGKAVARKAAGKRAGKKAAERKKTPSKTVRKKGTTAGRPTRSKAGAGRPATKKKVRATA